MREEYAFFGTHLKNCQLQVNPLREEVSKSHIKQPWYSEGSSECVHHSKLLKHI